MPLLPGQAWHLTDFSQLFADDSLYPARPICYADDLQSFASALLGLQDTAILVSVCAIVFNLSIAVHKLRAFHYCGLSAPSESPDALIIFSARWTPHTALIRSSGTFTSPGVEYPVNQADSTSLHHYTCSFHTKNPGYYTCSFHQVSAPQVCQSRNGKVFVPRPRRIRRHSLLVVPKGI